MIKNAVAQGNNEQHRYALRRTREKLCDDGLSGLRHEVFTTLLFVQSLDIFIPLLSKKSY